MAAKDDRPLIGVLAIQGSFREHMTLLSKCGARVAEVRQPQHLVGLQGLVLPGGESTAIANVAEKAGLMGVLREFAQSDRPVWGTCAGMILLANGALGQKKGGQSLIGGLDVVVHRNFFGSQLNSFEATLPVPEELRREGEPQDFRAIFIRAPGVVKVGEGVEVLLALPLAEDEQPPAVEGEQPLAKLDEVVVAVRQKNMLATAFHPELTGDIRWHRTFVESCKGREPFLPSSVAAAPSPSQGTQAETAALEQSGVRHNKPPDLPVLVGFAKEYSADPAA